jgi:hypothetical protein
MGARRQVCEGRDWGTPSVSGYPPPAGAVLLGYDKHLRSSDTEGAAMKSGITWRRTFPDAAPGTDGGALFFRLGA